MKKARQKKMPGQQPAWVFPAPEANPVLNPKPKSEEEERKQKEEWDAAIKYLKYRAHSTPVKPAPPKQLLTLVGAFLASYGFNNTCRVYQLQCNARSKLDGWDSVLGATFPEGFPDLVTIFNDWLKTYHGEMQLIDDSSIKQEKMAARIAKKEKKEISKDIAREAEEAAKAEAEETTSSGTSDDSSSDSNSDIDVKDASRGSLSPSSSSYSSDSDADDENDTTGLAAIKRNPTVNGFVKNLKRKDSPASSSSSESSASSSCSESEPAAKRMKKTGAKQETTPPTVEPVSAIANTTSYASPSSSSSSSSSSAESESGAGSPNNKSVKKDLKPATTGTDDFPTHSLKSTTSIDSESSSSSSDSDENDFPIPKGKRLAQSQPSSESSATLVPTPTTSASIRATTAVLNSSISSSSSSSDADFSFRPPSRSTTVTAKKPEETTTTTTTIIQTTTRKRSASPTAAQSSQIKQPKRSNPSFTRIPSTTAVDPKFASNAYQPYDYAERAHQDLSVTRGKGFTKEKNKKKRGSYRGGMIDIGGGKGVKFED
ncbi:MAG: hypothetical protein Q9201_005871 [Fulgogasparrea decipioides]